jgi:hypothetical protein
MDADYTGLWMSADHEIRKMLLPNGRYVAVHGGGCHEGEYRVVGNTIEYYDDAGATGASEFIDGALRNGKATLFLDGYEEMAA